MTSPLPLVEIIGVHAAHALSQLACVSAVYIHSPKDPYQPAGTIPLTIEVDTAIYRRCLNAWAETGAVTPQSRTRIVLELLDVERRRVPVLQGVTLMSSDIRVVPTDWLLHLPEIILAYNRLLREGTIERLAAEARRYDPVRRMFVSSPTCTQLRSYGVINYTYHPAYKGPAIVIAGPFNPARVMECARAIGASRDAGDTTEYLIEQRPTLTDPASAHWRDEAWLRSTRRALQQS